MVECEIFTSSSLQTWEPYMPHRPIPLAISAFLLALGASPASAGVFGTLGNFDVVNDTGQTAHGFEIDLEGYTARTSPTLLAAQGAAFRPRLSAMARPPSPTTRWVRLSA
jgi:hypothetical protein